MTRVEFPDVETLLCDFLRSELSALGYDYKVQTKPPESRADGSPRETFILVRVDGGVERSIIMDAPRITIGACSDDEELAASLAGVIRSLVTWTLPDRERAVYGTKAISRPYSSPDPLTGQPRYLQTHEVRVRGRAVTSTPKEVVHD